MKKICLLATGGTIASEAGANGLRPQVAADRMLRLLPELKEVCQIEYRELMSLDSSNLLPEHWQRMARSVAELREDYDGFVISHGTDTMAYSASALYYMLENIDRPVVLTGAQIPIEDPRTDGKRNLLTAFRAAASGRPGVYLAFDGRIIQGNRVKKLYTENFSAFLSINTKPAGYMSGSQVSWTAETAARPGAFQLHDTLDTRVFVLKLIPGMEPEVLEAIADRGYHAIIIEGYGSGGVPTADSPKNFLPAIRYAVDKGVLVICTTQCIYDGVHLERYEVGVLAGKAGALSGGILTIEALTTKLMVLMAESRDRDFIREKLAE